MPTSEVSLLREREGSAGGSLLFSSGMAVVDCPPLACVLLFLFCSVILACVVQVQGQSQEGFISIDCGIADGLVYQDSDTKITFTSDTPYTDAGENKNVSSVAEGLTAPYRTLRSFPNGTRNCYILGPVRPGGKYLVRAGFWYGNYDGKSSLPVFDLHLGVNFWTVVDFVADYSPEFVDIITVALMASISVCLVNTDQGTPFISTLELRPLLDSMYAHANQSQSLVLIQDRTNYGANTDQWIRYPDDPYDRIWSQYDQDSLKTTITSGRLTPKARADDGFQIPSSVLRTAYTTGSLSKPINQIPAKGRPGDGVYVAMHFAEVEQLLPNETRAMNIRQGSDENGRLLFGNYSPPFLVADAREVMGTIGKGGTYVLPSITASDSSTRPPTINALEVYALRQMDGRSTDNRDVDAIQGIKRAYKVKRNWMGDPCAPKEFLWDGVGCSYAASQPPRIIYLNLTSSGFGGGIPSSIANLTALTTLDLSNNNLTGAIPDFLAELPSLKLLNLAGNKLTGMIPRGLCEKVQNISLSFSAGGNLEPCSHVTKKKKSFIPVTVVASSIFLVFLVICILLWKIKRRRQSGASHDHSTTQQTEDFAQNMTKGNDGFRRESHHFTFSEIINITKNFETKIGKGGFGTVYLGYLNDGTHVAVKVLSQSSSQGIKEFTAEAVLLTRVHHKNLISLFGYCDEEDNLALVYEYMDRGTLRDQLSGKIDNMSVLSWEQRLKIVLQAAQGLDYLHNGCSLPIIHRDVKSTNILLNHNFVAKLADFGLTRTFDNENLTHVSTAVAGTLGYLDPEYYETSRLNEKSDVYSFGIVLLEIITGQPPFQNSPETIHIAKWVHSRVKYGDISSIVDGKLCGVYDTNSVWKVLEIAMACTRTASARRLTMSNVVTQLRECLVPDVDGYEFDDFDIPSRNSLDTLPLQESIDTVPLVR